MPSVDRGRLDSEIAAVARREKWECKTKDDRLELCKADRRREKRVF